MKKLTKAEQKLLGDLVLRAQSNGQPIPSFGATVTLDSPAPVSTDAVKSILDQRGARYGDFTDHARLAQQLIDDLRFFSKETSPMSFPWESMPSVHRQALTVIIDKIARILNGDPNYDDNWIDIQGYARLVQERLSTSE